MPFLALLVLNAAPAQARIFVEMSGFEDKVNAADQRASQIKRDQEDKGQNTTTKGLTSFFSFVGLSYGDTVDDVHSLFGTPERKTGGSALVHLDYFYGGLKIAYDRNTEKVKFIHVIGSAVDSIKAKGITDEKLDYIGQHRDDIFRIFGRPVRSIAGNHMFKFSGNGRRERADITFICYEFWNYSCRQMSLHWY